MGNSFLLSLGHTHIEWLVQNNATVHSNDCLGGLFSRGEANKAKPFAPPVLVCHYLGTGDVSKLREGLSQLLIIQFIFKVLDVQITPRRARETFHLFSFSLTHQFPL